MFVEFVLEDSSVGYKLPWVDLQLPSALDAAFSEYDRALGPVSHGRTVSFTGIRLLVFGYYEYQYLYASNRFNLSVSQNLNTQ